MQQYEFALCMSKKEDTIYKLNAQIGEIWYPESEIAWSVELEEIDSIFIFDNLSRVLRYRVDGLILRWITLSDKFGPYHEYSPGEPPGTTNWTSTVHYCIINGIEYGEPVSVNMNENKNIINFFKKHLIFYFLIIIFLTKVSCPF